MREKTEMHWDTAMISDGLVEEKSVVVAQRFASSFTAC
jgi:hypothetical protein